MKSKLPGIFSAWGQKTPQAKATSEGQRCQLFSLVSCEARRNIHCDLPWVTRLSLNGCVL